MISLFLHLSSATVSCPFVTEECNFFINTTEMANKNAYNVSFETECSFNFTDCKSGGCYTLFDTTSKLRVGYAPGITRSLFEEVNISGADWKLFDSGIVIRPQSTNFTLSFLVKNKTSFYTLHPFEPRESVSEYEISKIKYGLPVCHGL